MQKMTSALFIEAYLPIIIATVLALVCLLLPVPIKARIEADLANPIITIVSILIAFIATSMTIILTGSSIPGIKKLLEYPNQYRYFIKYHTQTITAGVFCCCLSLVTIVIARYFTDNNTQIINILHQGYFTVWVFSFFLTVGFYVRVVSLLQKFLIRFSTV